MTLQKIKSCKKLNNTRIFSYDVIANLTDNNKVNLCIRNKFFSAIYHFFKGRNRIEIASEYWYLDVNRDGVCAADDTFGHKIVYQIDSDTIDFKEFICKAFSHQIKIVSSDFNATFLALVTGGSTWNVFIKQNNNGELFEIAKLRINEHQKIEKIQVIPKFKNLSSELLDNKTLYCMQVKMNQGVAQS